MIPAVSLVPSPVAASLAQAPAAYENIAPNLSVPESTTRITRGGSSPLEHAGSSWAPAALSIGVPQSHPVLLSLDLSRALDEIRRKTDRDRVTINEMISRALEGARQEKMTGLESAISSSQVFYELIQSIGLMPSRFFQSWDDEVGFAWSRGSGYASVGFSSDGFCSYYAREPSGQEIMGDGMSLSHLLKDQALVAALKAI